jgi:hypothetical protein
LAQFEELQLSFKERTLSLEEEMIDIKGNSAGNLVFKWLVKIRAK